MGRRITWLLVLLLCVAAAPQHALASGVDLLGTSCVAQLPDRTSDVEVANAGYVCGKGAPAKSDEWIWLRLDASALRHLPAGWNLLVDQTRFDELAVVIGGAKGFTRITKGHDGLEGNWAAGGMLKFEINRPGEDIRGLYLGFRRIDDLSLMRKVRAVAAEKQVAADSHWFVLMGVFAGTLLSALLYNVVIHTGRRYAFQRWYLLWVLLAFAYGMVWTNMAALVLPDLVGPEAVRLDYILVGLMISAGNMFLFAVIEQELLPRKLVQGGHILATAGAVLGCVAAADQLFPAALTDRWLNYAVAATAIWVALTCVVAIRRGSRVIWFYMIGWGPVICVFVARLGRNLGLVVQNDAVDMATFAALAFEALVLSLAIADRFRMVRRELDEARQRREIDMVEAKALRLAAQTDFLTGLGNRSAFQQELRTRIEHGMPFSLLLIDVDYLKDANDRLGHAGGDALLQRIARGLADIACMVPEARVARIGGDEFAMIFPSAEGLEPLVARAIGDMQGLAWHYMDQARALSLSVGAARFPQDADEANLLYHDADLALYNAKRLGRGRLCHYDPLLLILRDMQAEFTADAERALQRNEFHLYVQPIVTLGSGERCGYEALLRWQHPEHGLMLPDRFAEVLVAERIGTRIQEHVLELALKILSARRHEIAMLSVNFTSAQLAGPRAARRILERLAHHDVQPSALCIEVTEGVILDRAADNILATLRTLQKAGVHIALDDFGTGLASLVHLRKMPIDRIKIDRSFVAGLDEGGGSTLAIVRAIIGLARGLGKIVVAEGVETEEQAEQVRALGCHMGQGFLYGRPAPEPLAMWGAAARVELLAPHLMEEDVATAKAA